MVKKKSPKSLNTRIKIVIGIHVLFTILGTYLLALVIFAEKSILCTEGTITDSLVSCSADAAIVDIFFEFLFFSLFALLLYFLFMAFVTVVVKMVVVGSTGHGQSFKYYYNIVLWVGLGLSLLGFGI